MTVPTIRRAPPIEFVGDLEVLKPPLRKRQRNVGCARISYLGISDYITQPNDQELQKFRAIEGPYLPLNLAERLPRLQLPPPLSLRARNRYFVLGFYGQARILE